MSYYTEYPVKMNFHTAQVYVIYNIGDEINNILVPDINFKFLINKIDIKNHLNNHQVPV